MKKIAYVILLLLSFNVVAEIKTSQTLAVKFFPQSSEGKLEGCILGFQIMTFDTTTSPQTNPIVLQGNITVYIPNIPTLQLSSKIGITNPKTGEIKPANSIFLKTTNYSTLGQPSKQFDSPDNNGYRFYIFDLLSNEHMLSFLLEMRNTHKVQIAFSQRPNGLDVYVDLDLDLDVQDIIIVDGELLEITDSKTMNEFNQCVDSLVVDVGVQLQNLQK